MRGDCCWEVGKNYKVNRRNLTWLLQELGIFFLLEGLSSTVRQYLDYGDSKMRLTCESMVCIYMRYCSGLSLLSSLEPLEASDNSPDEIGHWNSFLM